MIPYSNFTIFSQEFERSFSEESEDDGGVVYREADDYVEEEEEVGYSLTFFRVQTLS